MFQCINDTKLMGLLFGAASAYCHQHPAPSLYFAQNFEAIRDVSDLFYLFNR